MNALRTRIELLQNYLEHTPNRVEDIAYTLGQRREHLKFRAYQVCEKNSLGKFSDAAKIPVEVPKLEFVFTGQGAQWAGMGKELMSSSPIFKNSIGQMDKALKNLPYPPAWTLHDQLCETSSNAKIDDAELSQPLTTAFQIGIVDILKVWGIYPDTVVGHSSGEIAAAYAAGSLTIEDAIITAYYRGQVAKQARRDGRMAVVGIGKKECLPYLTKGVVIACENSPESITISGDMDEVETTLSRLREGQPGIFCRQLKVKVAYHSGKSHYKEHGVAQQGLF